MMGGGKKKRDALVQELDPREKELFLKAFFDGELPHEAQDADRETPPLDATEQELFLRAVQEGFPRIPRKEQPRKSLKPGNRAHRRGMPDARLDLHGLVVLDASKVLLEFLQRELERGSKSVLVIHGKGSGALRDAVWSIVQSHPGVLDFQVPSAKLGGGGSLLIRLHRKLKGRRIF